ncbi:MAG: LysR family transcriptional regulator [Mailhella sp.]|nr:LysR family transcriptional regulator [Mailhella sp.]
MPLEEILGGNFLLWLRTFQELARSGNWSAAARRLNVTRAAVKYSIRSLEERVKTPLLASDSDAVVLTDAGRSLLDGSFAVMDEIALMLEQARHAAEPSGTLSVAVPTLLARQYLGRVLGLYSERCPDVSVSVYTGNTEECFSRIRNRTADVMFGPLPDTDFGSGVAFKDKKGSAPELESVMLGDDFWMLALPASRRPSGGWTRRDVSGLTFVLPEAPVPGATLGHAWHGRILDKLGITPEKVIKADSGAACWFLACSLGSAAVINSQVGSADGMECHSLRDMFPPRKLGLTMIRDSWRSPAEDAFIEVCKDVLPKLISSSNERYPDCSMLLVD